MSDAPQFELQQACAGNRKKDCQQADESSDIVVPMKHKSS